jgi:hypothetical protein
MIRGRGHRPDVWDPRAKPIGELLGARIGSAPASSDGIRLWSGDAQNQGQDECCVGEALEGGIYALQGVERLPQVHPSSLAIWYAARALDGTTSMNVGCRPGAALLQLQRLGYVSAEAWPRERGAFADPWPGIGQAAIDQHALQWYAVDSDGEQRCEEIRAALEARHPVCLALQVDRSFDDLGSALWSGLRGTADGGHYLLQTHYDADGIYTRNSWGRGWGVDGYGHVAWSVIASGICSDVRVLTYAPGLGAP